MVAINKDLRLLVVNPIDSSRKMLEASLRLSGYSNIESAYESFDGYRKFKEGKIDVVVAALSDGASDAIALTKSIRQDAASPNPAAPVVGICGPRAMHLLDAAREVGITELIQAPYRVEDVASRLNFIAGMQQQMLESAAQPQEAPQLENFSKPEQWPNEMESEHLTNVLIEHYLKHHEIVLSKLKFAQTATKTAIDHVREKIKGVDRDNIQNFQDFDKMWQETIAMFVEGGMSEDDLFKIESIITTIPADIKEHYDELSQADKEFVSLVASLNTEAYKKARDQVGELQSHPSPYNGKTPEDFKVAKKPAIMPWYIEEEEIPEGEARMFEPHRKGKS